MADPVSLTILAVGAALSVMGTLGAARAQRQAGQAQAAGNEFNAQVAEGEAKAAGERAADEEFSHRDKVRQLLGRQRALYAKAGVDFTQGSPLAVFAKTAEEGEEEALRIRKTGAADVQKWKNEATLQRYYGQTAIATSKAQSNATLIGGLGAAATSFGMGSKGMWKAKGTI